LTSSFAGATDIMVMNTAFVGATNMMMTVTFEATEDSILEGEEFFTFSLQSEAMLSNHSFRVDVEDDRKYSYVADVMWLRRDCLCIILI
jgi:hypothetical protein